MASRGIGLEQARRQKWLTGLVIGGISVTALAVGLTFWVTAHRRAPPVHIPPSPAPDVNQQVYGYTFTRSDKGQPVFTIHAARTVSYQQGKSTELEDVTAQFFGPKGDRGDILKTHRCEYNSQTGDFLGSGRVEIELSPQIHEIPGTGLRGKHPIYLETSKVAYHQEDALAETEEPVKFRMGPVSGTALGMAYATHDGWLVLKHNVAVDLPQGTEKAPQPAIHLTASTLRYDKAGGRVALAGPVEVAQGKRHGVSDSAVVTLDQRNRVSGVDLEGGVKATDADPLRSMDLSAKRVRGEFDAVTGQLRHITAENEVEGVSKSKGSTSHLTADRLEMDMAGSHPQPLGGLATGNVHIGVESQTVIKVSDKTDAGRGPERKMLTAAEVHFEFRPDHKSLKDAKTVGPGTLLMTSPDKQTGEKVITAGQFLMTFDNRSRIESLKGNAPTEVLFRPAANAPPGSTTQQAQGDHLDAIFDAGTQTLRTMRQSGNFRYRDGDRQASADEADYDAQSQTTLLHGQPEVWDPNSHVKCQKISIDMRTNTFVGEGKVQATHLPSPSSGTPASTGSALPINVLAGKMVAQRQSQTIRYEGGVRAWQGTDVLESPMVDVYRTQRRMSSGSQVTTSFVQPETIDKSDGGSPPPSGKKGPVTVRADRLEYFDEGRRARYHGNVHMVTESSTLQSDLLDVYFTQGETAEGSEVDHAEAEGHVKFTQPGRMGTSDRAEYYAGSGKVVLTGGSPILIDEKKGSTTGQRLTFFIHDDRLFVDGGEQSPSLSRHRVAK